MLPQPSPTQLHSDIRGSLSSSPPHVFPFSAPHAHCQALPMAASSHPWPAASPSSPPPTHTPVRDSTTAIPSMNGHGRPYNVVDHSLLSTHSTASATASRIEVRDVAELVRQLAESRYTARQLQQRMRQLEVSAATTDSLHETPRQMNTSMQSSGAERASTWPSEARQRSQGERLHTPPPPPPAAQQAAVAASSSATHAGTSEKEERPQHSPHRQRQRSSRISPSHTHRTLEKHSAPGEARGIKASRVSEEKDSSTSSRSSSMFSSSSSMTSTSTFLSTSGLSSMESSTVADAPAKKRRTASSTLSSASDSCSNQHLIKGAQRRTHRSHAQSTRDTDRASKRKKESEKARASKGSNSDAQAIATRSISRGRSRGHRSRQLVDAEMQHQRQQSHSPSAALRKKKQRAADTRDKRGGRESPALASAERAQERSTRNSPGKVHQYASTHHHRHRRHISHEQPTTSLSEKQARAQEADQLRRARRWQKRYYDLMSKYADETAQRAAEMTDIHDLIEYMSWEQDRARRLHPPHTLASPATITTTTEIKERLDGMADTSTGGNEPRGTQRESRGTSPQRDLAAPKLHLSEPSRQTIRECTEARERGPDATRTEDSPVPLRRSPGQQETNVSPHRPAGITPLNSNDGVCSEGFKEVFGRDLAPPSAQPKRVEPANPPLSSDDACRGPSYEPQPTTHPMTAASTTETASLAQDAVAAAHYVQSLRSEADAWRQRCLELLQTQSEPYAVNPSASNPSSMMPGLMPSSPALPPPLPPRPGHRTPRSAVPTAAYQPADLVLSFNGSATPRAWEVDSATEKQSRGADDGEGYKVGREDEDSVAPLPSSASPPLNRRVPYPQRAGVHVPALFPSHSAQRDVSLTAAHAPQKTGPPSATPQLHRYAPPPGLSMAACGGQERRRPPAASAAAMHALYLATEQRHVDLSPLESSPQRPSLFMGLPDYRQPDRDWYSPLRWAAAQSTHSPSPLQRGPEDPSARGGGGKQGNMLSYETPSRGTTTSPEEKHNYGGLSSLHGNSTTGQREAEWGRQVQGTRSGGSAEMDSRWPTQAAPPQLYAPPPPISALPAPQSASAQPLLQPHVSPAHLSAVTAAAQTIPFSSYAPELFQTAPPSSTPASAELVVAREQLERDIRRHDQLLAAIGKLQKTASQHTSRNPV